MKFSGLFLLLLTVLVLSSCSNSSDGKTTTWVSGDTVFVDGPAVVFSIYGYKKYSVKKPDDSTYIRFENEIGHIEKNLKSDSISFVHLKKRYIGFQSRNKEVYQVYDALAYPTCIIGITPEGSAEPLSLEDQGLSGIAKTIGVTFKDPFATGEEKRMETLEEAEKYQKEMEAEKLKVREEQSGKAQEQRERMREEKRTGKITPLKKEE